VSGSFFVEIVGVFTERPMCIGLRGYFINPPDIYFDFSGATSLLNTVKTKMIEVFKDELAHRLAIPNCQCVLLDKTSDVFLVKSPDPLGMLELVILNARNLPATDVSLFSRKGSCDPYCVIRCGGLKFVSPVIHNTLNPVFSYKVAMPIWNIENQNVIIQIFDEDTMSQDDEVGTARAPLYEVTRWGRKARPIEIVKAAASFGKPCVLCCAASWFPFHPGLRNLPDEHGSVLADGVGYVSLGIYKASRVHSVGESVRFWIECECIGKLLSPDMRLQKSRKKRRSLPKGHAEDMEKRMMLQKKIRTLQSHDVSKKDIVEILGLNIDPEHLLKDVGMPNNLNTAGEVVWNDSFGYLVASLREVQLKFTLMCSDGKNGALGSVMCELKDLMTLVQDEEVLDVEGCVSSQVSVKTLVLGNTNMELKLRAITYTTTIESEPSVVDV